MLPLPTVGPVEILIIVLVGVFVAFSGSLIVRIKRLRRGRRKPASKRSRTARKRNRADAPGD